MKMKKWFLAIATFAVMAVVCAVAVGAENYSYGDFSYTVLDDGTVKITDYNNGNAEKVDIPKQINGKSVTSIGDYAFEYCPSLADITIPDSVTNIGEYAFNNTALFKNQTTAEKYIGTWVVDCDNGATNVTIKDGTTGIANKAFYNCTSLTSIMIPDSVTYIGKSAFSGCASLTTITIPESVTSIDHEAFFKCISLTSISIPNGVKSIGLRAFVGCTSLTNITIPSSVTSIGDGSFVNCTSLTEIKVSSENANYASVNGVLYNKNKTTLIYYPAGKKEKNYTIINGVMSIADSAFSNCGSLTGITISDSVTSIGDSAFFYCTSLSSITIPNSVTEIGNGAFINCTSLESIAIPNSMKSIANSAFSNCENLKSITIPDSVTKIGWRAFSGCTSLENIAIPNSVTNIDLFAFSNTALLKNQTTTEKYADKWVVECDYDAKNITIKKGTVGIADSAFEDCTSLTGITIPDSLTNIGYRAFYSCSSLKTITIPDSVTYIGDGALGAIDYKYYENEYVKLDGFKIYCYSNTAGEQYAKDNGFTYELLDKPTLAKVSGVKLGGRAADALRINWTKNANADGYIVETYQGNKWVRVAKITNNSTTTFRKAGLKAGTVYKFRVKAYKMYDITAVYSEYSATVTARTNPSVIKGAKLGGRAADALRINWSKNASADGYIVEMYQGNKWVRVGKITSGNTTTFRKAGLKASTVYKFRVRAYKMSGSTALYGNYSATVTARTNPSIMKGVKIGGKAKDALRVNWAKNASAQGYIVEMYKGGKWVRVAKITNGNTTTFRKAGLAKNTAYKFRVCAYYMSGKTALYGNYGSVSGKTAAK